VQHRCWLWWCWLCCGRYVRPAHRHASARWLLFQQCKGAHSSPPHPTPPTRAPTRAPGPNMGGKSVYLRMAAALTVMAHVGAYVPAASMELTVCDAVLSRMGAADDLSSGRSTFAEETQNAAEMLRQSTPRWVLSQREVVCFLTRDLMGDCVSRNVSLPPHPLTPPSPHSPPSTQEFGHPG